MLRHYLSLTDEQLEAFDRATDAAEDVLQVLLDHFTPEEIVEQFQNHVRIHMEVELEGAKKYDNDAAEFRAAVNDGRESA